MKEKKLFDAITEVSDELIEEARITKLKKKKVTWKRWGAIAASICVVTLAGTMFLRGLMSGNGGCGDFGRSNDHSYMFYAGPVFPLKLSEADDSILAERNLTYDLANVDHDSMSKWGISVTDEYILENTSDQDKTVVIRYPFVSNFWNLEYKKPTISVNGKIMDDKKYAGDFIGGLYDLEGMKTEVDADSVNFGDAVSWEDYKNVLCAGTYETEAFSKYTSLEQKVVVYEFTDFVSSDSYQALTQAISFQINQEKTKILTYGFNGYELGEEGNLRYSFFVPDKNSSANETTMLIVLGEDIGEYMLKTYKNGACNSADELDITASTVVRNEYQIQDLINTFADSYLQRYYDGTDGKILDTDLEKMYINAVVEAMHQFGILGEREIVRYETGSLEDVFEDVYGMSRVFYSELSVEIPAKSSVKIQVDSIKNASHERNDSKEGWEQGYDMLTKLGSNLNFTKLTAQLVNTDDVEIVEQNYGFDLEKGITNVELDLSVEHYYLGIDTKKYNK